MLDIRIAHRPSSMEWQLAGDLTVQTTATLRTALHHLVDTTPVDLDLSGLRSADRAGVAALVGFFLRAREVGAAVALTGTSTAVVRVLRAEGLDRLARMTAAGGPVRPRATASTG